ncbi:unnamed protein product, partial [Adineta ricciae]
MTIISGPERPNLLQDEYLHDIFLVSARHYPNKVALRWLNEEITYDQLRIHALNIAHTLRNMRQIGPGSIVGICLSRSALLHATILGVLMTGATYVPFDADIPEERVNEVLSDLKANLLLIDSRAHFSHPLSFNVQSIAQNQSMIDINLKDQIDKQSI